MASGCKFGKRLYKIPVTSRRCRQLLPEAQLNLSPKDPESNPILTGNQRAVFLMTTWNQLDPRPFQLPGIITTLTKIFSVFSFGFRLRLHRPPLLLLLLGKQSLAGCCEIKSQQRRKKTAATKTASQSTDRGDNLGGVEEREPKPPPPHPTTGRHARG